MPFYRKVLLLVVVVLLAIGVVLPPAYAQDGPRPAVTYRSQSVKFYNNYIRLTGTLTIPEGKGPHPAVILMSGSGPNDRSGSVPGFFPIFATLADALSSAGIAVLRYDDRGTGGSSGVYQYASIFDLATDAQAAIDYLRSRPDINPNQVGAIGHSEGGSYAAILGANPDSNVAFLITLAAATLPGADLARLQIRVIGERIGTDPDILSFQLAFLESTFPLVIARDWAGYQRAVYAYAIDLWELLEPAERSVSGYANVDEFATAIAKNNYTRFANESYASLIAYDPAADWAATTVPVLALYAELDVQVPPAEHSAALAQHLANNPDVTIIELDGANHLFQAANIGSTQEYSFLDPEFTPDFLPTIIDWLLARVDVGVDVPN